MLSVPSPWMAHYFLESYLDAAKGSPMPQDLTAIFMAEFAKNFVLTHLRAASHGVSYIHNPDQCHGPGFLGE